MPTVDRFTDSMIRDLSFKRELDRIEKKRAAKRGDREAPKPPTQLDFFEARRKGRAMVLTLTQTGNRIWSLQWYQDGRPKRKKVAYFDHSDANFPKWNSKEMREYVDGLDIKKEIEEKLPDSFEAVAEDWYKRHVEARGLRTAKEIRRHLEVYVYPSWRNRKFVEIKRIDVNRLLDKIADAHGLRMADCVLTTLRSMASWYQTRDGNYVSPIVKGMKRDTRRVEEKQRDRILSDDEIKAVWTACEGLGQFGDIVRLCLLTGQRREKVATIKRTEIDDDGIWTITVEPGEKNTAGRLKLPQMALDIIDAQPRIDDIDYVFASTRGRKDDHFNAWSQGMEELREKLPKTPHWVVHDLRRTCRSLMARLGVSDPVAERVLGHALSGVLRVYNRHSYEDEKAEALQKVADHITGLLPSGPRVVDMPQKPKRKAKAA